LVDLQLTPPQVFLVKLWRTPTYKSFLTSLTLCGYVSFMFGWHVHEKAVLLVLVPLSLLAAENHAYFRTFLLASCAGVFSLFPLLFTPAETFVKIVYSALWAFFVFNPLNRRVYWFPTSLPLVILDFLEKLYLAGFPILQLFVTLFPLLAQASVATHSGQPPPCRIPFVCPEPEPVQKESQGGLGELEFLPLMLTSVYCAVGLVWAFLRLSVIYLREQY
jgi:alpha-1,3-glucosyltransferase